MKKILALTGACTALLLVGLQSAAAGHANVAGRGNVVCTDAFSGTARNVIVPPDSFCALAGATVTHSVFIGERGGAGAGVEGDEAGVTVGHDVVMQEDAEVDFGGGTRIGHDLISDTGGSLHLEATAVGHDLLAFQPGTVQTGQVGPETPGGEVTVGHNVVIHGSPPGHEFVFDGMCALDVGHDLSITDRSVTLGIGLGDEEVCANQGQPSNTIRHDLVMVGNSALSGFFGPSSIEVGNNTVGHDLLFVLNTAVPGGFLEVRDNVVRHDAICAANDPPPSGDDPSDGPNRVGHRDTCD
jgi:hypothetical protein